MAKFKFYEFVFLTPTAADPDDVCDDQQAAGAGDLLINGAYASGGVVTWDTAHKVDIQSAGNLAGVDFTVTGTDQNGAAQTETIGGPNNSTVTTTKYWKTITQVSVDGAVGTDVSVGVSDEAVSPDIVMNYRQPDVHQQVSADIGGTINYDIQKLYSNPFDTSITKSWVDSTDVAGATADGRFTTIADMNDICTAVRIVVNSYTVAATCVMDVMR
jgi:hypothetical protein